MWHQNTRSMDAEAHNLHGCSVNDALRSTKSSEDKNQAQAIKNRFAERNLMQKVFSKNSSQMQMKLV